MILKIVCFFKGHIRGKLVTNENAPSGFVAVQGFRQYRCPRCGHETRYKVKPTDDAPTPPAAWTGGV